MSNYRFGSHLHHDGVEGAYLNLGTLRDDEYFRRDALHARRHSSPSGITAPMAVPISGAASNPKLGGIPRNGEVFGPAVTGEARHTSYVGVQGQAAALHPFSNRGGKLVVGVRRWSVLERSATGLDYLSYPGTGADLTMVAPCSGPSPSFLPLPIPSTLPLLFGGGTPTHVPRDGRKARPWSGWGWMGVRTGI